MLLTDTSDSRQEHVKRLGADFAVNTLKEDYPTALFEAFGPDKAHMIYECSGTDITLDQAIQNARKGSFIILVAVFVKQANVDLSKLNDSELDMNTSMMYRHEDYVETIALVQAGKIQLKPHQNAHFAFEDYLKDYEFIDNNRETTMKVLVDVDLTKE